MLIDHQPYQFTNLHSHEPTMIVNNVIGLAKTAKLEWHHGPPSNESCARLTELGH